LRHNVPEIVWSSGWSRDGERLLLGTEDTGLVVVDPTTWRVERRVYLDGGVQTIAQSPDGRILALANEDQPQVWLLDAASLEPVRTLELPASAFAFDLSFSPDGRWLAAGADGGSLSVFDSATWRLAQPPVQVDNHFVAQLEWLPDGRTVVASGRDGTVSLYDVRRGLIRARPLPGSDELGVGYTHMIPGPSEELVVLSGERAGRRYPMRPARWLADACAIAARDLTRAEWNRYLPDRAYERTCTPLL
jgi:WD40 repeat protein